MPPSHKVHRAREEAKRLGGVAGASSPAPSPTGPPRKPEDTRQAAIMSQPEEAKARTEAWRSLARALDALADLFIALKEDR